MSSGISRRTLIAATATGAAGAALAAGPLAGLAAAAARTPKVLVIGLDGAGLLDRIKDADAPTLDALMAGGLTAPTSLYASPMARTESAPGWSTIITGVWPDKHGVKDNSFSGANYTAYPDFLTRIERARPALSTYAVASWAPITDTIFSSAVDQRDSTPAAEYDTGTTSRAVARIKNNNPDAVFLQLDNVDHAGHSSGAASQAYLDAIHGVDAQVAQILAAVKSRPTHPSEDWLILITADHGHTDAGGHGGSSRPERSTFIIANGSGIPAGSTRYDTKIVDIAATALAHLGIPADPSWNLDGRSLKQTYPDPFDALRPQLSRAVDETDIGSTVLGFTHTPPPGWSIDNSAMGTGGVTEWRGWSFTTDEFWTKAAPDQQRESNVRARGIFAVADGDEWSDKPLTGTFASTLTTPAWPVTPGTPTTLTYTSHYRQESPQKGEVLVSYDNGTPQTVKTHTTDGLARQERIPLQIPVGARSVRIQFRYTGGNNWYWVIDGVTVTAG
ncbi:nucleotide pyrophosphatase [Streptomyces inhibens]|uniref:Nucleotide pyrophosphatase n=1 Tax=Streptomyces inhibens TaxID=2293571 RepID=A0A371Q929_STRIH|nr:alkaline phosphatase family protein [Streptomyces inhibens]REK90953.1 nucleotide pyrophosphatase [Streptomyces inhibens]